MSGTLADGSVTYGGAAAASFKNFEALDAFDTDGDDVLIGGDGADFVTVGTGSDKVTAGGGNDLIYESLDGHKDSISGGGGDDSLSIQGRIFSADFSAVVIKASDGTIDVTRDGVAALHATSIEHLSFTGAAGSADVTGLASSDYLDGSAVDDSLNGAAGDDTIRGEGGDDKLTGGAGNDVLTDTVGTNSFSGGSGDDAITTTLGDGKTVIDGGSGTDSAQLLHYGAGAITMTGDLASGAKIMSGGTLAATVKGIEALVTYDTGGNDVLIGGVGDDRITAGLGGDKVTTGSGEDSVTLNLDTVADTVDLGKGTDQIVLAASGATDDVVMSGSLAKLTVKVDGKTADHVTGAETVAAVTGSGDDTLFGGALNDSLSSGLGADKLSGGAGDDALSLNVDKGKDVVDGGSGNDYLLLFPVTDVYTMTANSDDGVDVAVGGKTVVHASSIEALQALGSIGDDVLVGVGGGDHLIGGAGDDKLSGGAGNDILEGGPGNDRLDGGKGDDILTSTGGVDTLIGGSGHDTASFGQVAGDIVLTLKGGDSASYTIDGAKAGTIASVEAVYGGRGDDVIKGDSGDNVIGSGAAGSDALSGGGGHDVADFGDRDTGVTVTLDGSHTVTATAGDLVSLTGFESVTGSNHDDALTGDGADNRLFGLAGNDALAGGDGNDVLDGGAGSDVLTTGGGHDVILFDTFLSAIASGGGFDDGDGDQIVQPITTIADFSVSKDMIELSGAVFGFKPGGDVPLYIVGDGKQGGTADLVYDEKTGILAFDADGKHGGAAIEFAHFTPGTALTEHNFAVV